MHEYDEDRRAEQCIRRGKSEAELDVYHTHYTIEANDRHAASRGLFATAELLAECLLRTCAKRYKIAGYDTIR